MRKRMIDPGYWSDDKIIELQPEQRLLFIGMWNFADDTGVLKNSPKQLKAQIFPADLITEETISGWLNGLYDIGLIQLNKDKSLIKIKGWDNYQKINRPQPSKYEFIEENHESFSEHSVNNHGTFTPNRKEEKIIEKNRKESKGQKNLLVQTYERFEQFYKLYPRKIKPHRAKKAWISMTNKERDLAISALPNHIKYWNSEGAELKHIPHPATWLNGKEWESELDTGTINSKINEVKIDAKIKEQREYYDKLKETSASPEDIKELLSGVTSKLSSGGSNGRS